VGSRTESRPPGISSTRSAQTVTELSREVASRIAQLRLTHWHAPVSSHLKSIRKVDSPGCSAWQLRSRRGDHSPPPTAPPELRAREMVSCTADQQATQATHLETLLGTPDNTTGDSDQKHHIRAARPLSLPKATTQLERKCDTRAINANAELQDTTAKLWWRSLQSYEDHLARQRRAHQIRRSFVTRYRPKRATGEEYEVVRTHVRTIHNAERV
jgi:hypothetical protein